MRLKSWLSTLIGAEAVLQRYGSKWHIAGGGILLGSVVTGLAAWLAIDLYGQTVAARRQELGQFATLVAEIAERGLQAIDLAASDVVEDIRQKQVNTEAALTDYVATELFHTQLERRFVGLPQADSLLVVGADGHFLNDSRQWPPSPVNVADRAYFQRARGDPGADGMLSEVLLSRTTGVMSLVIVRQIRASSGEFLGLVLGGIRLAYFEELYHSIQVGDDSTVLLALRDGTMLVRYPAVPNLVGRHFDNLVMPPGKMAQEAEGAGPLDGKWRLVSMRSLTHYPAAVDVSIDRAAMLASWWTETVLIGLAAALLDLAIAAGVTLMLRQMRIQRQVAEAARLEAARESRRKLDSAAIEAQAATDRAVILSSLATAFEERVGTISRAVAAQAGQVQTSASALTFLAGDTMERTRGTAAEAASGAADVNTIAEATEALSVSIESVSLQAGRGAAVITTAAAAARGADATMATLTRSADHIGQIVDMISGFARRTHLLALNATIEAARAGEAGRGFAVVAAEVKTLSKAVSEATEDIKRQIGGIQAATTQTAGAMKQIRGFVTTIEAIASDITHTMEEHRTATQTIAGSISQAAGGAHVLSNHIGDASHAAIETGATAVEMQAVAQTLADQADALRTASEYFLMQVKAG